MSLWTCGSGRRQGRTGLSRRPPGSNGIQMFPMALVAASNHLRSRGYDCKPAMLEMLIENGVVTPAKPDAWTQARPRKAQKRVSHLHIEGPSGSHGARA